ncbi:glycosyltransferase family 2 protein [Variovorax sp. Sphag1AA]|uniref:glycosyltransferase n=1 Tax=Variovorax sp. Sphag1AA TaxID=2587027 RepID=UPI00161D8914|nr:glycosyltransferase [Variovorax sp. Sphag1AA]MBB3178219.1 glycosyltransferase involved in cell wall biosynthesis [Variovorax sp. Sphag1AA]
MIGIVIPAHNEEQLITAAVDAAMKAARHDRLRGEAAEVLVVLDSCHDATGILAAQHGARTLPLGGRNVGFARAAGAAALLALGARWLSFTDADSEVSDTWVAEQLSLDADAVCGTVSVEDWSCHGDAASWLASHFHATYRDTDGHCHVHGANLGVSAAAYRRAGGFRHLRCGEDRHLVHDLAASGAHIAWSARPRVLTSARRDVRAKGGFGSTLAEVAGSRRAPSP